MLEVDLEYGVPIVVYDDKLDELAGLWFGLAKRPDHAIPYPVDQKPQEIPLHDHRDNHNGGLGFSPGDKRAADAFAV